MLFVVTLSDELWYPGREKKVAECWKSLSFSIFALHQVKQSETVTIPIEVSRHFLCFCVWRSFVNLDCRAEFQHSSEELTVEWLNSTTHERSNKSWKRRARLGRGFFFLSPHTPYVRVRLARYAALLSTLNRFWEKTDFFVQSNALADPEIFLKRWGETGWSKFMHTIDKNLFYP